MVFHCVDRLSPDLASDGAASEVVFPGVYTPSAHHVTVPTRATGVPAGCPDVVFKPNPLYMDLIDDQRTSRHHLQVSDVMNTAQLSGNMLRMVADLRMVYHNSTRRYMSKGFSVSRMMRAVYKYGSSRRYGYVVDPDDLSSYPDRKLYMLMWATPIVGDTISVDCDEMPVKGTLPYPRPETPEVADDASPLFHSDRE